MKQIFITRVLFIVMLSQFHFLKKNVSKGVFCLGSSDIKISSYNNTQKANVYKNIKKVCANDRECILAFIQQIKKNIQNYNLTANRKRDNTLNNIHDLISLTVKKIVNSSEFKKGSFDKNVDSINVKMSKSGKVESDTLGVKNTVLTKVATNNVSSKDEKQKQIKNDREHEVSTEGQSSASLAKRTDNVELDVHKEKKVPCDNEAGLKGSVGEAENAKTEIVHKNRLNGLRKLMDQHSIDIYILFNTDEHNSEMINTQDKKIYHITKFSGTHGILIIPKTEKPKLFVVALYDLQAHNEVDPELFDIIVLSTQKKDVWLETISKLKPKVIAVDGKNTPVSAFNKMEKHLKSAFEPAKQVVTKLVYNNDFSDVHVEEDKISLFILEKTLINITGKVNNRDVFIHEVKYNGVPIQDKLSKIKDFFKENDNVHNMLVSELDEVAYILNLRGYDYPYSPVFFAYLLFQYDREKQDFKKIVLFTKKNNINDNVQAYLKTNAIVVEEHDDVVQYLKKNIVDAEVNAHTVNEPTENKGGVVKASTQEKEQKAKGNKKKLKNTILLSDGINLMVYLLFKEEQIVLQSTPIKNMKAVKNETEIANMIEAHILDAVALLRFFSWVEEKKRTKLLFKETEVSLSKKIDFFRSQSSDFISLSFTTISAIGKNSAVIHYEPTKESDTRITPSMYLLDSGGQYMSGTTDVTRTTHFGKPNSLEKKMYTLVLKGHLHLKRIIFPSYVDSRALDFIARSYLSQYHFDYNHGTGHGVGLSLNVHEGGCSITPSVGTPLKENMVLSNEPGIYLENKFGVRIENMQYVVNEEEKGFPGFLSFSDLTLYPYDTKLFDFSMLTKEEINEVNEYHAHIKEILMPIVKLKEREYGPEVAQYLESITKPISITQANASFEPANDLAFDSTTDEFAEETFEDSFVEKNAPAVEENVPLDEGSNILNKNKKKEDISEKRLMGDEFNNS